MSVPHDIVKLTRDCDAVSVPYGECITLTKDQEVYIMRYLGEEYTVNLEGNMVTIDGKDADALGKVPIDDTSKLNKKVTKESVIEQLKHCYDPEIPVNCYDLGLIYNIELKKSKESEENMDVFITMTLTAPGCGMGNHLVNKINQKIKRLTKVNEVTVELTYDPPWSQDYLSEAAKLQLGMF